MTSFESNFDIEGTSKCIRDNKFERAALQLPDEMMSQATQLIESLNNQFKDADQKPKFFLLGDTSYGSCCVDEIAAQHLDGDVVVHYGKTCFSRTSRLPVYYVFGNNPIDTDDFLTQFQQQLQDKRVILFYDTPYEYAVQSIRDRLTQNVIITSLKYKFQMPLNKQITNSTSTSSSCNNCECVNNNNNNNNVECVSAVDHNSEFCGRQYKLTNEHPNVSDYTIVYIGDENSRTLNNLIMNFSSCEFFTYNPENKVLRKETLNVNRALMQRYYLVQKAKDSEVIGILVGTLAVAQYLEAIEYLKKIIRNAGRKFYTFVVGKLNVPKLANFQEIDLFVIVACPENSLIDSKEFFKPIVTPFELEIALVKGKEWTGNYSTDFSAILTGLQEPEAKEEEEAEFSFITGSLKKKVNINEENSENETVGSEIAVRNNSQQLTTNWSPAANYLSQRTYRGLEQKLGETEVTKAVEGMSGIPMQYDIEKKQ